jgi:hypothetical protein
MIWIQAVSADAVEEAQAVPLTLDTSGGDAVDVQVPRSLCVSGSEMRVCRQLSVTLKPGRDPAGLHGFLAELDAAFLQLYPVRPYTGGVVEVFSGPVSVVKQQLAQHPHVHHVEDTGSGQPGADVSFDVSGQLRLVVPTRDNSPRPLSGLIRVHAGDTLTARYQQPDGSELTESIVVPRPPTTSVPG